jgi:hypothetical protein
LFRDFTSVDFHLKKSIILIHLAFLLTGTIDMFEFTTLVKDTQAGKVQNLGKPLQQNNALTTSNALIKANEDWSKRGGKPTVGTAPKFASDDIINRRASQKAAIVDPTGTHLAI